MVEAKNAGLLREVAKLFVQSQRSEVACCGSTTLTRCHIITEVGRAGELTQAELGRRLSYDKSWTSRAVEALVQEGLLAKVTGQNDRRTVLISLTPSGQDRFRELTLRLDTHSQRVIQGIPDEERETVYRSLELLLAALRVEASQNKENGAEECRVN